MLTFKVAYLLWVFIFVAVQTKATNGRSIFSIVRFKFHSRLLVVCHPFLGVCVRRRLENFVRMHYLKVLTTKQGAA